VHPQLAIDLQQAIQYFQNGKLGEAELLLKRVLLIDGKCLPALHILGLVKASQGNNAEAVNFLKKAVRIDANDASLQYNLANALAEAGLDADSLPHYKKAIDLAPGNQDAYLNYGKSLSKLNRHQEALAIYERATPINPLNTGLLLNKSIAYQKLGHLDNALKLAEEALAIHPESLDALLNKGVLLKQMNRFDEALITYDKALGLNPQFADAWFNRANALNDLRRLEEASQSYQKALELNPNIPYLLGKAMHLQMRCAEWDAVDVKKALLWESIDAGNKAIVPFDLLGLTDSPDILFSATKIWSQDQYSSIPTYVASKPAKKERVRIGYFSADFGIHPVSFLSVELFELHDRSQFEIFAFSFGNQADNYMLNRIRGAFDHFIDVKDKTDQEIASLARELGIEIAIDLGGHTTNARTSVFAYRAAPIQINYLGYAGTMGTTFHDYIIADKTVLPDSNQPFYTEKVAYLPNSYMVDDSKRVASPKEITRQEFGLPENTFIFCCFNNDFKLNEQVIHSWSNILLNTLSSVLWLSENNAFFKANLYSQLQGRGIDPARVIFAKRMEAMPDHLARLQLADLFLDTFPYNAHASAVDSLKAGTPVVTLLGNSFAARVAASLLKAIDLPELITHSQSEYESLAIELATHPEKIGDLKKRLLINSRTQPLFDTALYTKHIEAAFKQMYARHQAKLAPTNFDIPA
jgi:predicted O-linked N-acetylglucosamine transferase (SPINDLY family)